MNINYFKFSKYCETLESQSFQASNTFLTGSNPEYWTGKGDNHGVIVAYDWIPSSGSLKLLEFNTNIQVSPQASVLDPAIEWFKDKNYDTIVLVVRDDDGMEIPNSVLLGEMTQSLQNNGLTAIIYTQDSWQLQFQNLMYHLVRLFYDLDLILQVLLIIWQVIKHYLEISHHHLGLIG